MAKFDPKSYAKNVVRSAGYIGAETIKGINPTLTNYISESASAVKDMYATTKGLVRGDKSVYKNILGDFYENVERTGHNILDDIRTGKFYNPERQNAATDKFMKEQMGFDFDDFDFDVDEDYGEDASSSSSNAASSEDFSTLSKVQQTVMAASSSEITRNASINAKNTITANSKLFGHVNTSLSVINSSILAFHQDLAAPLNNHIINSTNFYQSTTEQLAKQTALLENMNKMLTERFGEDKPKGFGNTSSKTSAWEEIMGNGNLPDLRKLGSHVKKKVWDNSDAGMLASFFDKETMKMLFDSGMLDSPIALIAQMALTSKIQNGSIGKSMNRLNSTLAGGFGHVFNRIHNYNKSSWGKNRYGQRVAKNGALSWLASLFDIIPENNNKVDTSKFNKGRADWTGIDSKALTEVIPTQLAKILSAINGQDPEIYDYKLGRWIKSSNLKKEFEKARTKAIDAATLEFRDSAVKNYIDSENDRGANISYNSRSTISFIGDYNKVMQHLITNNLNLASMSSADVGKLLSLLATNGVIDRRNIGHIKRIFTGSKRLNANNAIMSGRIANTRFMEQAGQDSNFAQLYNNSNLYNDKSPSSKNRYKSTILGMTDDKGNDIFFYLQNYYKQLEQIKHSLSTNDFRGGRGKRANRAGNRTSAGPVFEVPTNNEVLERLAQAEIDPSEPGMITKGNERDTYDEKTKEWKHSNQKRTSAKSKHDITKEEETSPFAKAINKITDYLSNIFIGDTPIQNAIREEGILGAIKRMPDLIGESVSKSINNMIDSVKNWGKDLFDKFKNSDFGQDFFSEGKATLKGFGKAIFNHGVRSAGNVVEWATGKRPSWAGEVEEPAGPTAAKGGYVKRSGMVSVSEGELIIPSEMNPFYKGRTNKTAQKATEMKNYRDWVASGALGGDYWGNFAKGGTAKEYSEENKKKIRDLYNRGFTAEQIAKKLHLNVGRVKRYIASINVSDTAEDVKNGAKSKFGQFKDAVKNSAAGPIIDEMVGSIKDKVGSAMESLFGKATTDTVKDLGKEAVNTIKKNAPKSASSAAIGAIVGGALTGSGLGLLGGAVLGAGITVVKNSDKISEFLFGSEDGKKKGHLPKKVQKFIKEQLPDLAKSGALGSILGAVGIAPGGILGGFALGAGIQMLSNNEYIKDKLAQALFGNKDVNGERHGGIVGSIQVRIVDPIADYVKDKLSTLGDYLKDNFLKPVTKIFDPLKDWIKGKATKFIEGIGHSIAESAKGVFRNVGEIFDATFGRVFSGLGKIGKGLLSAGGKVLSAPFKLVGAAGDALEKHNIKKGYSTLKAKDRVAALNGKTSGYNKHLAGLEEGSDEYNQYIRDVNFYANGKKQAQNVIDQERSQAIDTAVASIANGGMGNPKLVKQLRKQLNSKEARTTGDFSGAYDFIKNIDDKDMSAENKQKVIEMLTKTSDNLKERQKNLQVYDAKQLEFFKNQEDLGVYNPMTGQINKRALKAFAMQARTDMDSLKGGFAENLEKSQQELENLSDEKKQELAEEADILGKQRNATLNGILDIVQLIGQKIGVKVPNTTSTTANGGHATETSTSKSSESASSDDDNISDEERGYRYIYDAEGHKIKEVRVNGEWKRDTTDSDTNEVIKEKEESSALQKNFYTMFTSGGFLAGIKGLFGPSDDKDGEKKSIWETLAESFGKVGDKLFGENSLIGSILKDIGLAGGLSGIIKSALTAALPVALAGLFGKGLENASDKAAGTEADENMKGAKYDEDGGEQRKKDAVEKQKHMNLFEKMKHGADAIEYKALGKNMTTYQEDDYVTDTYGDRIPGKIVQNTLGTIGKTGGVAGVTSWLSKRGTIGKTASLILNPVGTAKNAITGIKNFGTKLANSNTAKHIGNFINFAKDGGKALSSGWGSQMKLSQKIAGTGYNALSNVTSKVADKTTQFVTKIGGAINKVIKYVAGALGVSLPADSGESIASTLLTSAKDGANKLTTAVQTAAKFLYWVNVASAVTYGFQSAGAKEILGIIDEPTIGQRALAALCNGINAAIPLIGGIVPTRTLVTVVWTVFNSLGKNIGGDDFAKQRATAESVVKDYNEANGTTYDLKEYLYNVEGEATIQTKVSKTIGEGFKNVVNGVKKIFNFGDVNKKTKDSELTTSDNTDNYVTYVEEGSNSSSSTYTGGASGIHVSQKGSLRKFGRSNIDKNGCGPAAAATILRAYGKNANINNTADYAMSKGYVAGASGVGTKAGYFGDILGSNGISTSYTTSKKGIDSAVASGHPTVLLGQDASNHSKSNSPFGPNPHYVVARGSDSNGNVLIDDPELGASAVYDKKILNKTKLGIMTGGKSGLDAADDKVTIKSPTLSKMRSLFATEQSNGVELDPPKATNNIEAIWGYFKNLGLSDEATAGILGNIAHEAGETFNPKRVENLFLNHLTGKSGGKWATAGNIYADAGVDVSSADKANETYTEAIDSGKISNDEFQHPYKMLNDPNYKSNKAKTGHEWLQYGYGLTQFTSPNLKDQLYQATVAQGKSIGDLKAQLDVINSQLESCGVMGIIKNSGVTAASAAETMLRKYEKPENITDTLPARIASAEEYYNTYKGKTYDIGTYTSSGTTFNNVANANNTLGQANTVAAASTSTTNDTSLSGMISSFFGNLFSSAANNATGAAKSILGIISGGFGNNNSSSSTTSNLGVDSSIQTSIGGDNTPSYNGVAKPVPTDAYGKGTPEAMVKIAQSQLGVVEGGTDKNGKVNAGNITDYGKLTNTNGLAWCASFVSWLMDQTFGGDVTKRNKALRGNISAGVSELWNNFKSNGAMTNTPQPGDVVIFKKNDASHTGIVETVNGNTITTIEGNTGSGNEYERNGGVVARHQFTIGDGSSLDQKLTGFGRPDWSGSGSGLPVYNFTGKDIAYDAYKGGASGTTSGAVVTNTATTTNTSKDMGSINDSTVSGANVSDMSMEKKTAQILVYLKQLVSNTGYNTSIPEIVDVLKDQGKIIASMNGGTTIINNTSDNTATSDTRTELNADISKMMAKLDAITQTL